MGIPRVSITGLTSVLAIGQRLGEPNSGQAPCVAVPARRILESVARNENLLPGPGVALTGALLGRLGVDCLAALDVGDDDAGRQLPLLLKAATPHLRPLIRSTPEIPTAIAIADPASDAGESLHDHPRSLPDLPPLQELRGAIGIWAGAEKLEAVGGSAFALPEGLERYQDTGLTRVVVLAEPGAAMALRNTEHLWLQACARHVEILCVQADHLLRYLDPGAASHLLGRGQLLRLTGWLHGSLLHEMASFLLDLGVGAVLIGLGEHGVYLRTHADGNLVAFARRFAPANDVAAYLADWIDREMLVPLFEAQVQNTFSRTAALAAGFASGLLNGQAPADLVLTSAAVISLAAENPNPLLGVPPWGVVQARIEGGWSQAHCQIDLSGWGEGEPHTW